MGDTSNLPYSSDNILRMLKYQEEALRAERNRRKRDSIVVSSDEDSQGEAMYVRSVRAKVKRSRKQMEPSRMVNNRRGRAPAIVSPERPEVNETVDVGMSEPIVLSSDSDESENEQQIKVVWCGNVQSIHRFDMRYTEKMKKVFNYFSNTYDIPIEKLSLKLKNRDVSIYDTVQTLNIRITDVLLADIIDDDMPRYIIYDEENEGDIIEVKCRMEGQRHPFIFNIYKTVPFQVLFDKLRNSELKCSPNDTIRLVLDGEDIKPTDTAESLDLDGGECFDMYLMH